MHKSIAHNISRTWVLIILFFILNLIIGYFFAYVLQQGPIALFIALLISTFSALISYYQGDKIALWSSGAKPMKRSDFPMIFEMVEHLTSSLHIPVPRIYLIQDSAPNAFATGRNPQHASIALTAGIISLLNKEELEGVIAHELSHIKNYDILVMTIVIVLVGTISLITDFFIRSTWFGRHNNRESGSLGGILFLIGLVLAIFAPIMAQMISLAISRKREYLADASGAEATHYPEGLASALQKISQHKRPMIHANDATAHLYIANPFFSAKKFWNLFSTHPPIEERIKRLRNMS